MVQEHLESTLLLKELLQKQLKDIPLDKKFQYNDLRRLCKYINKSLFDETKCSLWTGYVTNINNSNKGMYINFYYRKKKIALHRLLYANFVEHISDDEYLKFTCDNKGSCCNVNHLKKFRYQKKSEPHIEKPVEVLKTNFTIGFD
jgi:hypothetical protein